MTNKLIGLLILLCVISPAMSQSRIDLDKLVDHPWVDSVFNSLTPDERIAQLIWIDVSGDEDLKNQFQVAEMIRKNNFGGLIFFEGTALKQAQLINYYQSLARIPLLIAMDAEWGLGMRLGDVQPFPYNMTMGAVANDELVRKSAAAMAGQLRRLGVHINLGPVADINTESQNPIIGMRSFGESRENVTRKSLAYMKGLQENGIIAVAKHYPGHGDTRNDSHLSLPLLPYSRERLDSIELYPFKRLADEGIGGIMTAHLHVPALDPGNETPSSLSIKAVDGVIRKEWNYKGLIITDAMNMGGATSGNSAGNIDVKALLAGNDVIEFPVDGEATFQAVKAAILKKELSQHDIDIKCRRVLAAKLYAGLNHHQPVKIPNLLAELNRPEVQLAQRQLIESAMTLLENKNQLIPFQRLDTLRIAALSIGSSIVTPFQKMLGNYTKVDYFILPENFTTAEYTDVLQKMKGYNLVVTGIHSLYESKNRRTLKVGNIVHTAPERPYGVTEELETLLSRLSLLKNSVFVFFSNPYAINEIKYDTNPDGLLLAWQNTPLTQELAAQLLFGGIGSGGKLPVAIGNRYKLGDGIAINGSIRLKYTLPEEVGLNSKKLSVQIDSIVSNALKQKAFPGCNVLIAKDGKVIFQKAYGFHTYDNRVSASPNDIYDLASVSKVTGALPGIMKLNEEGKCLLDEPFSTYWRDWRKRFLHPSDKGDLTVREMLAHQSGLVAFLPFWRKSVSDGHLSPKLYSAEQDQRHNLEVAPGLYISPKFKKSVYKDMRKSPLKTRGKYVYSDLSLIIFPEVIVKLSGQKYTEYLDQNFYRPLGATTITYNPSQKFSTEQIVPTEYDAIYRKRLVHGSVHDESSAILGGLAGNAGLFASANDLAKLVQMYIQYGTYGGKQYLKKSTFEEFNRVQFPQNNNRRALGFDKPSIDNQNLDREKAYPCSGPSPQSFGHFGFTGTFFWADPANGLIYIFLSNRVYPTRESNKISTLNVRTEILQVMYDELGKATQLP